MVFEKNVLCINMHRRIQIKQVLFCLILLYLGNTLAAQDCNIRLTGQVIDESINEPLSNVSISIVGQPVSYTDSFGNFEILNLCTGNVHLFIFHIGCESKKIFIELKQDTFITLKLDHHYHAIKNVVLKGDAHNDESIRSIGLNEILASSNKSLAEATSAIPGVAILKTGNNVSKPIIDGFFGNRVQIVNDGVLLNSQQWGNDHAPEIDIAAAGEITVIKGAEMLSFPGNALGGVISIKRKSIGQDPHLHGIANYIFDENGRGQTANLLLQKGGKRMGIKWVGTYKNFGDLKTPEYFLTNTAKREANTALQIEKKWSSKWKSHLNYNFYHAEMGILSGSHIGNLTDLQIAIKAKKPFNTKNTFGRSIDAPRQNVNHHFLTLSTNYFANAKNTYSITYNLQKNNRKEFDIRRGGRSSVASLSLEKWSNYLELKRNVQINPKVNADMGIQQTYELNRTDGNTGIIALIPNYAQYNAGAFICTNIRNSQSAFNIAGRLDFTNLNAFPISKTLPKAYLKKHNIYLNSSLGISHQKQFKKNWSSKSSLLYVERAPSVNELYSGGLHQGVSGIEEGNDALKPEKSIKAQSSFQKVLQHHWTIKSELFVQNVRNFIFLQPQQNYRLTIRGAFPVFDYQQTNALLGGANAMIVWENDKHWENNFKVSYINGRNLKSKEKLIYLPPTSFSNNLTYRTLLNKKQNELSANVGLNYVLQQTGLTSVQDLKPAPPSYFLANAGLNYQWKLTESEFLLGITCSNLFNTVYRDYLNRQRYFADEQGRNIQVRAMYKF